MSIKILEYLLYPLVLFFIIGPLGKLPLAISGVSVYPVDLAVGAMGLIWLIKIKTAYRLLSKDRMAYAFIVFCLVAFISWLLSPVSLSWTERIISLMYLIRLMGYFSVYLTIRQLIVSKKIDASRIIRYVGFSGVILAAIGWVQYFLYPDLRNLYYLGWDPHYKRIFATFLDPNYFGLVLVVSFLALLFISDSLFLWLARLFVLVTLVFTYSRSSYAAFLAAILIYIFTKKKFVLFGLIMVIFICTVFILPKEGLGIGVRLERVFSLEQRMISWREGIEIFGKYPVLGVGFNILRYARREMGLSSGNWQESHAGAGIDNSFIFVLATTGIVGFMSFIILLIQFFRYTSLLAKVSIIAILIHSLFLNSFFYPWIMLMFWSMLAIGREK